MKIITFENQIEGKITPTCRIEYATDPEAITPEMMQLLAEEIAVLPEFAITYNGRPAAISIGMLAAAVEGGSKDAEGFNIDGFTSSLSTSGLMPKIWVPALTPRPWRAAELPEPKDPTSKIKPVPKDFTSGLLQRYFNLIEGEALREKGCIAASADEEGKKPKQLTATTIWRMMDPSIAAGDKMLYAGKVRSSFEKLFDSSTASEEITEMTYKFMAMVERLRIIQPE